MHGLRSLKSYWACDQWMAIIHDAPSMKFLLSYDGFDACQSVPTEFILHEPYLVKINLF